MMDEKNLSITHLTRLRTSYAGTGYHIACGVFSLACLTGIAEALRASLMRNHREGAELALNDLILAREAEDHRIVYGASQSLGSSAAAYRMLGLSGILDIAVSLTDFDPAELHILPMYLVTQLPSDERFDYTWHQDGAYYDWCPDILTLWFPVNRAVKRDTGTISVIPGSHSGGLRPAKTYLRHGFFRQMESNLGEQEAEREEKLELELGDCCIMTGNLVHRSVTNKSATPRVAGLVRLAHLKNLPSYDRDRFYCVHKS